MKAPFTSKTLKTFVFLTVALFFFSCKPEEPIPPTPLIKPYIANNNKVKNITYTSATLCATITPNQDSTVVTFEYKSSLNPAWIATVLPQKYCGTSAQEVNLDLTNLTPGTNYNFKVSAVNSAGSVSSSGYSSFVTTAYLQATVAAYPAESITLTTAKVRATITPNQANTNVSLEYKVVGASTWTSQASATSLSGNSPVEVNFELNALASGAKYEYRVKAVNVAGEVISPNANFETYAVADYDGNLYHSVTIGTQTWLKENFRGTHYANGDPIANVTNTDTWSTLSTGAYCWYNNDSEIGKVYGGLYNWYVGADARGLIIGWHTPTMYEWADLMNYLGGYFPAGLAVTEAGNSHWVNFKYTATNSSGFTALPNGGLALDPTTQKFIFMDLHNSATFWSSSNMGSGIAAIIDNYRCGLTATIGYDEKYALGLRLLKN